MKNQIISQIEARRKKNLLRLLSNIDADIVNSQGGLPVVTINSVGSLLPGGEAALSVEDFQNCWLETDDSSIRYEPPTKLFEKEGHIYYCDKRPDSGRHARKQYGLHFYIKLAGQRARSPPISG